MLNNFVKKEKKGRKDGRMGGREEEVRKKELKNTETDNKHIWLRVST